MKYLFFTLGAMVILGGGCGSSAAPSPMNSAAVPSTTTETKPADVAVPAPSATVPPASSDTAADSELETLAIEMTSGNFFDPTTITASPGQKVSVSFTDTEGVHTFVIDEIGLKKSISTGTVITFTAPTAPGSYSYYCDIGAHRKLGMEGVLVVK